MRSIPAGTSPSTTTPAAFEELRATTSRRCTPSARGGVSNESCALQAPKEPPSKRTREREDAVGQGPDRPVLAVDDEPEAPRPAASLDREEDVLVSLAERAPVAPARRDRARRVERVLEELGRDRRRAGHVHVGEEPRRA